MKRQLKEVINTLTDFVRLLAFAIRYVLHGCISFPLSANNGKSISVLGNGPSLKEFLENNNNNDSETVCVNFSPLTDIFYELRPRYLVLIDPEFFKKENERVKKMRKDIKEKVDWHITIITGETKRKIAKKFYAGNPNVDMIFVPDLYYEPISAWGKKIEHWIYRKGYAAPQSQNVVIAAIFSMINIGYSTINIYGVEHSWLSSTFVDNNNTVCLEDKHYYGNVVIPWNLKMSKLLYNLHLMFRGYERLRDYTNYLKNVNVINHTKNSWIDAFEKVNNE